MSGLLKDLEQRGLLDSTIVALGTEFGRTPRINDRGGRDHHRTAKARARFWAEVREGEREAKGRSAPQTAADRSRIEAPNQA